MASKLGMNVVVETSDAKSKIDALSESAKRLNENVRDVNRSGSVPPIAGNSITPRLTEDRAGVFRLRESEAVERIAPQTTPSWNSTTTGSIYGINSYNGQMSPGGIMRDGRRVNTDIDVDNVRDQLEELAETIEAVTADMKDARDRRDLKTEFTLSGTLNNLYDQQKYLQGQLRSGEREEKLAFDKTSLGYIQKYFMSQGLSQAAGYAVEGGQLMRSARISRASGDYLGADVMETKGKGEMIGSIGGTAAGLAALALNAIAPGLGTTVSMIATPLLSKLGGFIGGEEGANLEKDLKYSAQYKEALPDMEAFYQRFGENINGKTGEENSREALNWYNRASDMSMGTAKTPEELMQAAQNRAAYGNLTGEQALSGAREDIMWERYTGANLANIQRLSGTALRYGGDTEAVQQAFAGLEASGMGKGQFDEFLTSMQRIMEDGIEKGFVRGADEIAGNMSMLSKLSGESPLWTGEQGANRLMKMNESISNATNLRTIEDMISFSAVNRLMGADDPETTINEREMNFYRLNGGLQSAKLTGGANFRSSAESGDNIIGQIQSGQNVDILGLEGDYARVNRNGQEGYIHKSMLNMDDDFRGYNVPYTDTYIDNMITLERGLLPELLGAQMQAVQEMEGMGNRAGQIERYKNMFGLNYTGASKTWEMSQNADFIEDPAKYANEIDEIRTNVDYKSDAQKLQDAITKLTTDGINVGKLTFDKVEIPHLKEATEEMRKIHEDLQIIYGDEDFAAENFESVETVAKNVAEKIYEENPGGAGANHMMTIGNIERHAMGKTLFHKNDENGIALSRDFLSAYQGINPTMMNDKPIMDAVHGFVDEFSRANAWYSQEGAGISSNEEGKLRTILETLMVAINAFNNRQTAVNLYPG